MKFNRYDMVDLLGVTPLAQIQDSEIWNDFLTPQVKALMGEITSLGEPEVRETVEGHFPGDEVTNLNLHRLYAGSCEHVRFPYLTTLHKTEYGALVIKRDAVKVKADCWVGDYMKGKADLVFRAALRDRRFDGTKRGNDSALLFYRYDDPKFHRRLHETLRSAEISIYSFLPGSRILDATGEVEYDRFVEKPFRFIKEPDLFRQHFDRAWKSSRGPGQFAAPIKDVSRLVLEGFERVAKSKGYDLLEAAVSHYHVALWFLAHGYRFSYNCDAGTMDDFKKGIAAIKASGQTLTRPQESWVCVVQSLRPVEKIPQGLYLNGPLWMQDNIGPRNLWINKPLSDKAAQLLPEPQEFCPPRP